MEKHFLKACSMLLVIVLLVNMLPMSVFAAKFQDSITDMETEALTAEPITEATQEDLVPEDAYVVAELTENRTEFSKEFLLSNGLHMAMVYADAVHYETESGWEEIDNTLKANADGTYSNTAGPWDVTFPEQLGEDESITIEKDGYTLSFSMSGELTAGGAMVMSVGLDDAPMQMFAVTDVQTSAGEIQQIDTSAIKQAADFPETVQDRLQSQIVYADVYGNTDIVYDLDSNKVKESMILESYNADLQGYSYTLEVGTMIPVLEEDGSVIFYDENQENIVMVMPAPFLIDNNGEHNYDIEVQLLGKESTYTLMYLLPQDWLAADDRTWPVVLDPWIEAELEATNIRDRTVAQYHTFSQTQGTNICGKGTEYGIMRSYIKYAELPAITSSDVVLQAEMHMLKIYDYDFVTPVEVHKVLGDGNWDSSTLTWANKPNFDETIEDYAIVDENGRYTWIVTDIVQDWYSGANTGMLFKASNAIENGETRNYQSFIASDYTDNDAYKPTLVIYFRNNNGLESYWDYTTSGTGRAGTGYINNYTGNLTWVRDDIGFGGNRMPVAIQHVYNLNDAIIPNDTNNSNDSGGAILGMGIGWRTNFNQLVYRWNIDDSYYVWEDGDGTDHYFKFKEDAYRDEDGLELILTDTGSGTEKYCITDKNGNCSYFDTQGRLVRLTNNQETKSSITVTYANSASKKIDRITDGAGRQYVFTYAYDQLQKISYLGTGTTELDAVSFWYNGSYLTAVTEIDGSVSNYRYNGKLLASVTDVDGYTLTYGYNTVSENWQPYRVQSVEESDSNALGGRLTFSYAHNETSVTDYNGNTQVYQFNEYGNTISIRDDEGRAQFAQFARMEKDDTAGKANQLTLASKLQATVNNLLPNGSFEYTLSGWNPNVSSISRSASQERAYVGAYSLRTESTSQNQTALLGPAFSVPAGESLTFSAYLYTTGVPCRISLYDYVNYSENRSSEKVTTASQWIRVEVTYNNETATTQHFNVTLYLYGAGVAYMDGVQVERTASASRYNLVENGDFLYDTNWSANMYSTATEKRVTATAATTTLQATVWQMVGAPQQTRSVSQRIPVSGNAGDAYVLAGWASGNSAPLSSSGTDTHIRRFCLKAIFSNTDGTTTERIVSFNPDCPNHWQYVAAPVLADKNYSSILVAAVYDYNVNTVYFDGIQLYKEEFGTSYTYDEKGNVTSVKDLQEQTTTYQYDANSNLTQIIQDGTAKMTYTYDSWHNVETATTEEGLKYEFEYDTYGNNTLVSITSGGMTMKSEADYTDDGNYLAYTKDALGKQTTYNYDPDTGVLNWVQYPEDTDATRTEYTYDSMYRTASAACTTDTGLNLSAEYTYTDDLLTQIETPTTTYHFTYGDFSLRTGVSIGNRTLATYHYTLEEVNDRKYDLDRLDYGNGDRVQYEYDDQGRTIKQTYEDGAYIAYFYDGEGALAKVYDSGSGITASYTYDLTGRLVKYAEQGSNRDYSVSYAYNDENQLSTVTEIVDGHDRTSTYQYDDDGRITFFEKVLARRRYSYDAFGRVSVAETLGKDYAQIFNTTYTYEDTTDSVSGQVTTLTHDGPRYDKTYSYTYDNNGNILSVRDSDGTTTYVYDSANQLIRENNHAANFTHTWTYDNAGNILTRTEYAYTTGALGEPTDIIIYTYGDSEWGDLLTAYDGNTITYDEIGNPLSDGEWTYTWQHGRQLAAMSNGAATWDYTYDANGLRIGRTDGTDNYHYVYDGGKLTYMARNGLLLRFAYTPEGTPLSILYKGTTYYYVTNLQGDVTAILSQNGYVMVEYTYDAWGNLLTTTGPLANSLGLYNPLRYRGYIYDYETQLYYLQSRYYNPEVGRFLNADGLISTGQGFVGNNMFAYCGNNPIMFIDPTGMCLVDVLKIVKLLEHIICAIVQPVLLAISSLKLPPTQISQDGVAFIADYESFSATPYDDGFGNLTIGYGHLIGPNETFTSISESEALALLRSDLAYAEKQVVTYSAKCGIVWDQNEFDAFVSLAYNAGSYFESVMDKIIQGVDPYQAFSTIIYAGGRKVLGLYRRRMDEADMFVLGTYNRTDRDWPSQ